MLRRTSGLSRPVLKWVSQVAASLGATLSATLIWSAVPHPGAAPAAQATVQPELTSGGKFAARAVQPAAYDGLDTMPLPRLAPAPARFVAVSFEAAPSALAPVAAPAAAPLVASRRPAGEDGPVAGGRAARAARPTARVEARRPEPAPSAVAAATPAAAPEPASDEGFLRRVIPSALPSVLPSVLPSIVPAIASTARDAWTATASAGDALVARVVPRIP